MVKVALRNHDSFATVLLLFLFPCWCIVLVDTCPFLCECLQEYCDDRGITPDMLQRMTAEIPKRVRYIDLSKNKLDNIPIEIFEHFAKIHHLNLAANHIKDIKPGLFHNLTNLNKLNLQANLLSQLKSNLLYGLTQLEELHLECNYIETISNDTFSGLQNLKRIYLYKNNIGIIHKNSFRGLQSLRMLDASENAILELSDHSFLDLKHLTVLRLTNNQIKSFSTFTFAGLNHLAELYLDQNLISDLECDYFSDLKSKLQVLSLRDNELSYIEPNTFIKMDHLQKQFLDGNHLSTFELDTFRGLKKLKEIHLRRNKFVFFPRNMLMGADSITYADFSENPVTSISTDAFANFRESVRYLYIHKNRLEELHAGMFRRMALLRELDVSDNRISLIRENVFETLWNVRMLNLSGNKLKHIAPHHLLGMTSLENLYLHGNPLESFTGFKFHGREGLIIVTLNLTVLTVLPSSVTINWPYQKGTQLYWSMTGICLNVSTCTFREQATYFPAYTTSLSIDYLQPSSLYYICVNPVFMSIHVKVTQCLHIQTPPLPQVPVVMTTAAQVSGSNPSRTMQCSTYHLIMFLLIYYTTYFVQDWSETPLWD